jgi:hypothetical protein
MLAHGKFSLLAGIPLIYRPQVSDNPRIDFGILLTMRALGNFALYVAMLQAY